MNLLAGEDSNIWPADYGGWFARDARSGRLYWAPSFDLARRWYDGDVRSPWFLRRWWQRAITWRRRAALAFMLCLIAGLLDFEVRMICFLLERTYQ